MRSTRFWFGVYRALWHSADWVLTSRLRVPRSHPLRTALHDYVTREALHAERQRIEREFQTVNR